MEALGMERQTTPPTDNNTAEHGARPVLSARNRIICRSRPKPKAQDPASVNSIALGGLFSICAPGPVPSLSPPPSSAQDLLPILANIRASTSHPTVNTIPLPRYIHSHVQGWLQTKPSDSPSHTVEINLDKKAYAQLSQFLSQTSTTTGTDQGDLPMLGPLLTQVPRSL